jgi:uncharacterized membrane protein
MNDLLVIMFLTLLPFLELRASIPYGVFQTSYPVWLVFLIAVISNIILAPLAFVFFDKVIHWFLHINWVNKTYQKLIIKSQKKIHPKIEKYGFWGLVLFIAVPLPGSGVYSGALGANLLGFRYKEFMRAAIVGVILAGLIVVVISVAGDNVLSGLLKV